MLTRLALALLPALLLLPKVDAQTPSPSPSVKLSGYIQARETYQKNIGIVGTINRARLAASAAVPGNVTWRIQGEFRTGNVGNGRVHPRVPHLTRRRGNRRPINGSGLAGAQARHRPHGRLRDGEARHGRSRRL